MTIPTSGTDPDRETEPVASLSQRPIFIIGCPRSGTGLLHHLMRLHEDLAWVTPFTSWICGKPWFEALPPRFVRPLDHLREALPTAVLPTFLHGPYDGSLALPGILETSEGHSIWDRFCTRTPDDRASAATATDETKSTLRSIVHWHLRYHQRPRFIGKTPRNALRLPFLRAVFPDALFIHLVRDGRAVASSILRRRQDSPGPTAQWWGARPPGWKTMLENPPIVQAAWTWKTILETIEEDADALETSLHTVYYESLCRAPRQTLRSLFEGVDLDPDRMRQPDVESALSKIRPPHEKWRTVLDDEQLAAIDFLAPLLDRHGYADA